MSNTEYRLKGRSARKRISQKTRETFDKKISGQLENLLDSKNTVMVYKAIDGEVSITFSPKAQKTLIYPRVEGENIVPVKSDKFFVGAYGITEPVGEIYSGKIDAVIVPMCAYDSRLNRLGFGKGFYDRFLKDTQALKIGVAYSCQECGNINTKDTDIKMDLIVTEKGVLREK